MSVSNFLCPFFLLQISCTNKEKQEVKKPKTVPNQSNLTKRVSVIKIDSPKSGEMFTIGDEIEINIGLKESDVKVDSLSRWNQKKTKPFSKLKT